MNDTIARKVRPLLALLVGISFLAAMSGCSSDDHAWHDYDGSPGYNYNQGNNHPPQTPDSD